MRTSHASKPRPGVSGLKRVCSGCTEPVENAEMHPVLKVWLCSSCTTRLKEATRQRHAARTAKPNADIRHMMNQNRHAESGGV